MSGGIVTVQNIIDDSLALMDRTGSLFVPTARLIAWIDSGYKELYDLLLQKFGDDYFFSTSTITTDGTNETFALPADFYKLYGVDLALNASTDSWISLRQFNKADRNRYAIPNFQSYWGFTNLRYRLRGNNLWLSPKPSAGQTLRILYAPRPGDLDDAADTLDCVSGWEDYIVASVCINYCAAEETDPSIFIKMQKDMEKRIEEAAANRNVSEPATASDVSGGWGEFGGWHGSGFNP